MVQKTELDSLQKRFYQTIEDIRNTPTDNAPRFVILKKRLNKLAEKLKPLLEEKERNAK